MKIIITESQLESLIPEQERLDGEGKEKTSEFDGKAKHSLDKLAELRSCLPNDEVAAAVTAVLKQKNKIKKIAGITNDKVFFTILKYAVGILGRETDYGLGSIQDKISLVTRNLPGGSWVMDAFEGLYGQGLSLGPAQFTPGAWEEYGLDDKVGDYDNVGKLFESLLGAFYRISMDYKLAVKKGLGEIPSINPIAVKQGKIKSIDGTGNISMDLAIIAHNMGQDKITKYCKTNNPNYNAPCDSPNGLYKPFKDKAALKVKTKEWVPGYFPNLGFKKGEGTLTSIGYLEEVVERANRVTCLT